MRKFYNYLTFFKHILPAIIWGAGIFLIISFPGTSIPRYKILQIEHIDKVIHFIMFFGLSLLLCLGFFTQNAINNIKRNHIIYAFLISVAYGAITEISQAIWFASRSGNFWDFIANAAGAFAGVLVFNKLIKNFLLNKLKVVD